MQVRDVIKDAIERNGLSQYRVAVDAGVDRAFLNQVLAGKKTISNELIDKVAPVLGLDSEELKAWADVERIGLDGLERIKRFVLPAPIGDITKFVADFTRFQARELGLTTEEFMTRLNQSRPKTAEEFKKEVDADLAAMLRFISANQGKYSDAVIGAFVHTLSNITSEYAGNLLNAIEHHATAGEDSRLPHDIRATQKSERKPSSRQKKAD